MKTFLLIDVGNTQTEIGIYQREKKIDSWRISSKLFSTEDEIASLVRGFLKFKDITFSEISDIGISSVVPQFSFVLQRFSEKYFNITPLFVSSSLSLPIRINYDSSKDVGADRICGSVGAYSKYKESIIVIDFGTATTFDVLLEDGTYIGGAITLGLDTIISSLHDKASMLPEVHFEIPQKVIGSSTEMSIRSGVFIGHIEMVRGMISKIRKELKKTSITVIATGGIAPLLTPYIPEIHYTQADLILDGLRIILERNR